VSEKTGRLANLAAWAEIVAAIAVVASLAYVGREIRQNTAATEGATYQEIVRASNEYLLAIAGDSALAAIVTRGDADMTSLSVEDGVRYFNVKRVLWRNMENAYVQHERGVLADSEWAVYHRIACTSWHEASWPWHRDALNPAFVSLIESC
jgi:hypothetical protein